MRDAPVIYDAPKQNYMKYREYACIHSVECCRLFIPVGCVSSLQSLLFSYREEKKNQVRR